MQDSFGNPIPNPAPETEPDVTPNFDTPTTETPAAEAPAETPVETPAPVEEAPAFDAPAAEEPVADTPVPETPVETPAEAPTPVAETPAPEAPAAEPAAAPVVAPVSSGKSNSGLIIGIIIAVLIIAIIAIAAFVIPQLGKDNTKKDDNTSKSEEKKEEKKEPEEPEEPEEPATKNLKITYDGKSFTIYKGYIDTLKSLIESYDIYYVEESTYNELPLTDIEEYSSLTTASGSVYAILVDDDEDGAFEIRGSIPYSKKSEDILYTMDKLETGTIYFWANAGKSVTFSDATFTIGKTTVDDINKALGDADRVYTDDNGIAEYITYEDIDGCEVTFFMEDDDDDNRVIDFITFEYND